MKFQAPRGTRDYFPPEMARRRYLEDAWRRVSIRNGFEEIDGPLFESLELFKVKSGEGIVSELFHFEDRGGRELAIRAEFTPTLARMVADRAASLPRPIKWFSMPVLCRAERPQRGRLREFLQWNVDLLGSESPIADAECIATAVDLMETLGLQPHQVKVRISHRDVVRRILEQLGVPDDKMLGAFELLDRKDKITEEQFAESAKQLGLDENRFERFEQMCRRRYPAGDVAHLVRSVGMEDQVDQLAELDEQLRAFDLAAWCEYDLGIVRGLAYYTGTVFELHEANGAERALAGGGRYDKLIGLMGGPAMPAVGFGMGDVVLSLVLQDKGLMPTDVMPAVDVFVVSLSDTTGGQVVALVRQLRQAGLHARFSYRSTRNLGKLIKEADQAGAQQLVILDDQTLASGVVSVKDMASGEQTDGIALEQLANHLQPA